MIGESALITFIPSPPICIGLGWGAKKHPCIWYVDVSEIVHSRDDNMLGRSDLSCTDPLWLYGICFLCGGGGGGGARWLF